MFLCGLFHGYDAARGAPTSESSKITPRGRTFFPNTLFLSIFLTEMEQNAPQPFSPSTALDKCLHRLHLKFAWNGYHEGYTLAIAGWFLTCGWYLQAQKSLGILSLCAMTLALSLLISLLYQLFGGVLVRRSSREQAKWLCEATVGDALCDAIDAIATRFKSEQGFRTFLAVFVGMTATNVLLCFVTVPIGMAFMFFGCSLAFRAVVNRLS